MIPKWIWPLLLAATGILLACSLLVSLTGIGGSIFANLIPEGSLESTQALPINQTEVISPLKEKWRIVNRNHSVSISPAVDYVPENDAGKHLVYAPISGKVSLHPRGNLNGGLGFGNYGNYLEVENDQYRVLLAHFSDESFALIKNGAEVAAGTPLGVMGSTGKSDMPHLHLEMWKNGLRINPEELIPQYSEALASEYKESPEAGILAAAPDRPEPTSPGLGRQILQWLAGLATNIGEIPAKVSGQGTTREASVNGFTVKVSDERVNKTSIKQMPDARKVAERVAKEIPSLKGELKISLVDRICFPDFGCFAGVMETPHHLKIDPEHPDAQADGVDQVLAHELAHIEEVVELGKTTELSTDNNTYKFDGLTSKSSDQQPVLANSDELVVLVFTQPGDKGTNVLRPKIEQLRFLYPWIDFVYIDATTEAGNQLAKQYFVTATPTTILARAGREIWTWEGSIEGLEELLQVNLWLGKIMMAHGQIPLLGPAGTIPKITFAGTYGALCQTKGTLGLLGSSQDYPVGSGKPSPACEANGALEITRRWGQWVSEHNGGKTVINVLMPTVKESDETLIDAIIQETGHRNQQGEHWYVMLDLQSESEFDSALEHWVTAANPHVGIVIDIEWFGQKVAISSINSLAESYFSHRERLGLKGLGILGVWYFNPGTILADQPVTRKWEKDTNLQSNYSTGIVVPIMDGHGNASAKLSNYQSMMKLFRASYGGMMSFSWRWGSKYDSCTPEEVFMSEQLFWTQQ